MTGNGLSIKGKSSPILLLVSLIHSLVYWRRLARRHTDLLHGAIKGIFLLSNLLSLAS